jgi:hypothetical protein
MAAILGVRKLFAQQAARRRFIQTRRRRHC